MKGLSLEQFKAQLDTDAQKRCETQEKTIRELHSQLDAKDALIRQLENRCLALTHGMICMWCEIRQTCKAKERRRMVK